VGAGPALAARLAGPDRLLGSLLPEPPGGLPGPWPAWPLALGLAAADAATAKVASQLLRLIAQTEQAMILLAEYRGEPDQAIQPTCHR
jgi:hypothetical protein